MHIIKTMCPYKLINYVGKEEQNFFLSLRSYKNADRVWPYSHTSNFSLRDIAPPRLPDTGFSMTEIRITNKQQILLPSARKFCLLRSPNVNDVCGTDNIPTSAENTNTRVVSCFHTIIPPFFNNWYLA